MSNDYKYLAPDLGWSLYSSERISDLQLQTIDLLYQPIIGIVGTSLIHYFWNHFNLDDVNYTQQPHSDLYNYLKIDQRHLYRARLKLEGVGLLRTLVQKGDSRSFLVYQLILPLSPRNFFRDDLLSTTLLENIGEKQYQKLSQKLVLPKSEIISGAKDISHDFFNVFRINKDDLIHQPQPVKVVKNRSAEVHFGENQSSERATSNSSFDMNFLYTILQSSYVNLVYVKKNQSLIINLSQIYGINENEMSRFIIRATNVNTNVFYPKKLKLLINRQFSQKNIPNHEKEKSDNGDQGNSSHDNFSSKYKELIDVAKQYAPANFALQLKRQSDKSAFLDDSETKAIENLMNKTSLSPSVVNILIYHIINDLGHTTLSNNMMVRITNDWLQKYHVRTPEDAIEAIRGYNDQIAAKKKKEQKYSHSYRSKPHIDRKIPEWMKKKYDPKKDKVDPKLKKEAEMMIKKINNMSKK